MPYFRCLDLFPRTLGPPLKATLCVPWQSILCMFVEVLFVFLSAVFVPLERLYLCCNIHSWLSQLQGSFHSKRPWSSWDAWR
jgi:hypothetical protein